MEEQVPNIDLEIPIRWKRFFAYFLDLIINITGIWLIINLIIIICKKATLWNMLVWIKALDTGDHNINVWKACLRYFVFYSSLFIFLFFISQALATVFCIPFWLWTTITCISNNNSFYKIGWIVFMIINFFIVIFVIINIIEIFFRCPTFIDKRLWIKRVYEKSK